MNQNVSCSAYKLLPWSCEGNLPKKMGLIDEFNYSKVQFHSHLSSSLSASGFVCRIRTQVVIIYLSSFEFVHLE